MLTGLEAPGSRQTEENQRQKRHNLKSAGANAPPITWASSTLKVRISV